MNASKTLPLPEIRERLQDLSRRAFRDEAVLAYERFRSQVFSDITVTEIEYEETSKRPYILNNLIDELGDIVERLVVQRDAVRSYPFDEVMERNTVAAKITYKRALCMVRREKFCDAAMTTAFAVDHIADAFPALRDDPRVVVDPLYHMALGLLEETLTVYMHPSEYVASDCPSSCGYCQDPLSTVAKYCSDALESNGAPNWMIRDVWETAAAMLGAFLRSRGGDLEHTRFPDHLPRQATSSFKLMVYHHKADKDMILRRIRSYEEKLRLCRLNIFITQYGTETPIIPADF